jgi:geranylgeranyl diphosphate synthase type I
VSDQIKWRSEVDQAILATLAESAASLVPIGAAGQDLTQAIARATEGGKRVRSTILIASHHAHSGAHHRVAVTLAAAVELFHAAALLHDDVLDDSDTRRGRPSAHRVLRALHRERGWIGDPDAYGRAGAILAGDLALMASTRALLAAADRLPAESRERVLRLFMEMSDLVTAGQYLDMRTAAQPLDDLPNQEVDIRATMRAKTASYTCEMPLALGAAVAGAADAEIDAVREVGVPLGVAFQLRDDVLGLVGTAATGKPSGDDVREGKRTLVLYLAWMQATAPQRTAIRRALGIRTASASDVTGAIKAITATGVIEAVELEIATTAARARAALAELGLVPPFARILDDVAADAVERDR